MSEEKIRGYEDLKVWQVAMQLAEMVYAAQKQFPQEERYALGDQLRRAAVSVPSNIAEGAGRDTKSDFLHFLAIARGSLFEMRTQIELARRLGFIADTSEIDNCAIALRRMLNTFMGKLRASSHR